MIAKILLETKTIELSPLDPFEYASGLKGPIYCDNRRLLSFPKERAQIIDSFVDLIKNENLEYDCICGVATGAIAWGALIAQKLDAPFVYVRAKAKSHGKGKQIEGVYEKGMKFLVIEDLINQGKSLGIVVDVLKELKVKITNVLSIVNYEMQTSKNRFKDEDFRLHSLSNFSDIINFAKKENALDERDIQTLVDWQKDPIKWKRL